MLKYLGKEERKILHALLLSVVSSILSFLYWREVFFIPLGMTLLLIGLILLSRTTPEQPLLQGKSRWIMLTLLLVLGFVVLSSVMSVRAFLSLTRVYSVFRMVALPIAMWLALASYHIVKASGFIVISAHFLSLQISTVLEIWLGPEALRLQMGLYRAYSAVLVISALTLIAAMFLLMRELPRIRGIQPGQIPLRASYWERGVSLGLLASSLFLFSYLLSSAV